MLQPGVLGLALVRPFDRADVAAIKAIAGSRWDAGRRMWLLPDESATRRALVERFGANCLSALGEAHGTRHIPQPAKNPSTRLLERMGARMLLEGLSPKTRKNYLGHARRLLEWAGGDLGSDPAGRACAWLVHLVEARGVSRSHHTQAVSAVRFLFNTLGNPLAAQGIPRPRRERILPRVLGREEVRRFPQALDHPNTGLSC